MTAVDYEVRDAWQQAMPASVKDPNPELLAFGAHYRLQVRSALAAVWATVKAVVKTKVAIATLNPLEIFEVTAEMFAATASALQAVRAKMSPGQYLISVALSGAVAGLKMPELSERLAIYTTIDTRLLPWYSGISQELVQKASAQLYNPQQVEVVVLSLIEKDLVAREGDVLKFKDQNLDLSLFPSGA